MVCKAIEFSIHYLWTFLQGILTKAWKCLTWKRSTCSTHIAMLDQPEIVEKIKVSSLFVSCLEVTAINFQTINYIWLNYWHARILEITLQFIWHTRHSHFHSCSLQCTAWFIIREQNENIRSKLELLGKWSHETEANQIFSSAKKEFNGCSNLFTSRKPENNGPNEIKHPFNLFTEIFIHNFLHLFD